VVLKAIDPKKDVDGFHVENAGALLSGAPGIAPCTPSGIMELLKDSGVPLEGAHAVVVGRSNIVGKPVALLLLQANCTVTLCHSKTRDLAAVTRQADILVAAVGRPRFITRDMVKNGAAVVDVGVNRCADGSLCGDVDFEQVREVAGRITPVPGGVGPMTIAMLMANTLRAAEG
jgi:methylenetetrahydrofolate dehydrogenase (NADP+)/methenyltetrahydrofolate cyclohydrolase